MRDVDAIYNRLLAQGYQEKLFSDLPKKKESQGGKETLAECPFCEEDKKGHFSYSNRAPVWKCWKCGKGGDWIDYLHERRGLDFQEALRILAKEAGVELVASPEAKARHQAVVAKATILEDAQAILERWLHEPAGQPVLDLLRARGYSEGDIKEMGLGAYVSRKKLVEALKAKGHSEPAMREAGLLTPGFGETHQLTILWKDRASRPSGLVARAIQPDVEPKYKYSYKLPKKEGMIGFDSARGSKSIIVVEGPLDAALLSVQGHKVVATGGTDLHPEQLQAMEETGTEELILALDMDKPGQDATARIIRNLSGSSRLRLYVVSLPGGFKDPAEMVLQDGPDSFRVAVDQAQRAARWYPGFMVSQYDSKTARGLDQALSGAFEYFTSLDDGLLRRDFLDGLKEATGLAEEDLSLRLEEYEARAGQRRAREALQRTHQRLQGALEAGSISEAEDALEDGLHALQRQRGAYDPEPYTLAGLVDDVAKMEKGLSTGYKSLDEMMSIPRGAITIISGRPMHGKTAMMLNLLLNMARNDSYKGKAFFFFSYEESRARLAIKSLMILSGVQLHAVQNREYFIHYIKEKRGQNTEIERALQLYGQLTESGRIWMMDQRLCAEDLAELIGRLASRHDTGAIFVDYIQKVAVRKPSQVAYQDIKRASALLLDQAVKWDVPIIMGAQLSRAAQREFTRAEDKAEEARLSLDMLREAGDIEQDANLVLGLVNMDKLKAESDPLSGSLRVNCMKYRDGASEWMKPLQFIGVTQMIKEPKGGGW